MSLSLPAAPVGKQKSFVNFNGTTLETFTYRPTGEIKGILLDFHGTGRDAEYVRDVAVQVADKYGLYVVAPKFKAGDFSAMEYQLGGVVTSVGGSLLPKEDRTVSLVFEIAEWAQAKVGSDPDDEIIGFGHSAGAQFLSRAAAFGPDIFDKIIIANPSTHVRASLTEDMPYGFDGLPLAQKEAYLKDYLAEPVTIYVGSEDNDPNASGLASGSAAMRQGDDRFERAQFTYIEAQALAEKKGWEFNWELVVAKGVGHSSRAMLNAPEFADAFDGRADEMQAVTPAPASKVYDYNRAGDWHGEVIKDYKDGDVFDFRGIDAKEHRGGDQAFEFLGRVGPDAFTKEGGEIRLRHYDGDTYVYLNTDKDVTYEAKGRIEGIHHLTADDFLL